MINYVGKVISFLQSLRCVSLMQIRFLGHFGVAIDLLLLYQGDELVPATAAPIRVWFGYDFELCACIGIFTFARQKKGCSFVVPRFERCILTFLVRICVRCHRYKISCSRNFVEVTYSSSCSFQVHQSQFQYFLFCFWIFKV